MLDSIYMLKTTKPVLKIQSIQYTYATANFLSENKKKFISDHSIAVTHSTNTNDVVMLSYLDKVEFERNFLFEYLLKN